MRYGYDDFAVRLADFLPRLYACDDGFTQHPYLPIGDPFAFDQSDYDVTVLYPEEYALAAPGEVLTCRAEAERSSKTRAI